MNGTVFGWFKGHGTENDFVLLPDPDGSVHGSLDPTLVRALCHRRRGIGADGVLRVIRTDALRALDPGIPAGDAEWFMDYRNADGSVAEMCGNGIRVFALHLAQSGQVHPSQPLLVGTRAGVREVRFHGVDHDHEISADMGPAQLQGQVDIGVAGRTFPAHRISMGNPHAVVFVDDLAEAGPLHDSPRFSLQDFPNGVNVEFVKRVRPGEIAMRVYERGAGETRSCGTGACAAAVASAMLDGVPRPVHVRVDVPGGQVHVRWLEDGRVQLAGPAAVVAHGETSPFWLGL